MPHELSAFLMRSLRQSRSGAHQLMMVIVHTVRIGVIGVGTLRDVLMVMVLPLLVAVGSHPLNQVEGAAALLIHRAKVLDLPHLGVRDALPVQGKVRKSEVYS